MKLLITKCIVILIILVQPYITLASDNIDSSYISGTVPPINNLVAISYTADASHLHYAITYELSNNNANGYILHFRVHSADAAISITMDSSNGGFWGSENVSFIQSNHTSSFQQFTTNVSSVTRSTYNARFTIHISSKTPLSSTDIFELLSFSVQNHGNTFIALTSH